VEVVRKRRSRLEVALPDGRHYLVPAALLQAPGTPAITLPPREARPDVLGGWQAGDRAVIGGRGSLAGTEVEVVRRLRTRLEVALADGRHYLAPPALLLAAQPQPAPPPRQGALFELA
jgi:hypothetical protein